MLQSNYDTSMTIEPHGKHLVITRISTINFPAQFSSLRYVWLCTQPNISRHESALIADHLCNIMKIHNV